MSAPDISEIQWVLGDVMLAVQMIAQHDLPFGSAGAIECERLIREYNEGNRAMWSHPDYLPDLIRLAQNAVRETREKDAHRTREERVGIRAGEYEGVGPRGAIPATFRNTLAWLLTVPGTEQLWFSALSGVTMFGNEVWYSGLQTRNLFTEAREVLPGITDGMLRRAVDALAKLQTTRPSAFEVTP